MKKNLLFWFLLLITFMSSGKGKKEFPRAELVGDHRFVVDADSAAVTIYVQFPKELFNKQVYHSIKVFVLSANDYKDQIYVSNIKLTGDARDRKIERERRRNGEEPASIQWTKKYKRKKIPDTMEMTVKAPYRQWMDDDVLIYIEQSHSPRKKIPEDEFPYELFTPVREE
ncbi:MAG: hypothetical protein LUF90_05915 [Rikenellaceae bacterium]|nr:hypothetical protein [Rikenellaceae bacterium]